MLASSGVTARAARMSCKQTDSRRGAARRAATARAHHFLRGRNYARPADESPRWPEAPESLSSAYLASKKIARRHTAPSAPDRTGRGRLGGGGGRLRGTGLEATGQGGRETYSAGPVDMQPKACRH